LTLAQYARYRKQKLKSKLLKIKEEEELDVYFCRKGYNPTRSRFFPLQFSLSPFAEFKLSKVVHDHIEFLFLFFSFFLFFFFFLLTFLKKFFREE